MPNLRFLYDNLYGAATTALTASSEASALPVKASQNTDRTYVYRSGTVSVAVTIDIDLGSVNAVSAVAAANLVLFSGGALELYHRGDAGTPGAAVLVTTLPAADSDTRVAFAFFASQSHRHWQLKFTNPGAVSSYVELGYAFLGTYYEPTVNVSVPTDVQLVDPSVGVASVDGQKTFSQRTGYFAGSFQIADAPEAIVTNLRTIRRTVGARTPIFVVLDTALTWSAWLLRFASEIEHSLGVISGRYDVGFSWEEAR